MTTVLMETAEQSYQNLSVKKCQRCLLNFLITTRLINVQGQRPGQEIITLD